MLDLNHKLPNGRCLTVARRPLTYGGLAFRKFQVGA